MPNTKDIEEAVAQILEDYAVATIVLIKEHNAYTPLARQVSLRELRDREFKIIEAATATIKALITEELRKALYEVIGSDDITNGAFADINEKSEHFNELRSWQRIAAEELLETLAAAKALEEGK